jgi:hypothetical protein
MRIAACILATLLLSSAVAPASAPQEAPQNSPFRTPIDVSGLLDVCGEAVNQLDSPPAHNTAANVMKFGWCLGWAQALQERISEVHVYARFEEMNAKKEGRPPRSYDSPDKDYMNVCLPPDSRVPDLIRAIVKGLGEPPVQLHEPKNGPVKAALKKAFPCPATAKEEPKPADAKP